MIKLSADWVSRLPLLYSVSVSVVNNMQIYKIFKASWWANESLCCSLTACRYIHRPYTHTPGNFVDGRRRRRQSVGKYFESITSHLYSSAAKNSNAIKCQCRWTDPPLIECDDIIFVFATRVRHFAVEYFLSRTQRFTGQLVWLDGHMSLQTLSSRSLSNVLISA